jgi:hypothetical protein
VFKVSGMITQMTSLTLTIVKCAGMGTNCLHLFWKGVRRRKENFKQHEKSITKVTKYVLLQENIAVIISGLVKEWRRKFVNSNNHNNKTKILNMCPSYHSETSFLYRRFCFYSFTSFLLHILKIENSGFLSQVSW